MKLRVPIGCFDQYLRKAYWHLGRLLATYPVVFLVVPVVVTLPFSFGVYFLTFNNDMMHLFTPDNGQAKSERQTFTAVFPESDKLDELRDVDLPQFGELIVVASGGGNILRQSLLDDIVALDRDIRTSQLMYDNKTYRFDQLCVKNSENQCKPTNWFLYLTSIVNRTTIKYPVHEMKLSPTDAVMFNLGSMLGGVSLSDDGFVESAEAVRLTYILSQNNTAKENEGWERAFVEYLQTIDTQEFTDLDRSWLISTTTSDELEKTIKEVTSFFVWLFLLMITASVSCCAMRDWVLTKPWLGLSGLISCSMAICTSHGLLMYVGVDFISITTIAPFLVLAIGVDDMFVLLAAWRHSDPRMSVMDRMSETYQDAGVSITITTVTDAMGFLIGGALSSYPSVRIFCTYMGVAVLCDLAYQITFFGACMALTGRREHINAHALCGKQVLSRSQAIESNKPKWYRLLAAGGYTFRSDSDEVRRSTVEIRSRDNKEIEQSTHGGVVFFRDYYAPLLKKWPVKIGTVLFYIIYLSFSIRGCFELQEGLKLRNLYNAGSYAIKYNDNKEKYFTSYNMYVAFMIHNKSIDFLSSDFASSEEQLIATLKNSGFFHGREEAISCIADLNKYYERTVSKDRGQENERSRIINEFLRIPSAIMMNCKSDIIMDENNTISAVRIFVQTRDMDDSNRQMDMMETSRELASSATFQQFNMTTYCPWFLFFDQYITIIPDTLFNLFYTTVSMLMVSLLLIPCPIVCFWVLIIIISVCTGMIGFMAFWQVNLDSVAMINVIMSVCFSVDFSAHIAYTFTVCDAVDADTRMTYALAHAGVPITMSGVSTLIGVTLLGFSSAYIVQVFFKIMFLVIMFGTCHGLLFLPVLLNLTFIRKKKEEITQCDVTEEQNDANNQTVSNHEHDGHEELVGTCVDDPDIVQESCIEHAEQPECSDVSKDSSAVNENNKDHVSKQLDTEDRVEETTEHTSNNQEKESTVVTHNTSDVTVHVNSGLSNCVTTTPHMTSISSRTSEASDAMCDVEVPERKHSNAKAVRTTSQKVVDTDHYETDI